MTTLDRAQAGAAERLGAAETTGGRGAVMTIAGVRSGGGGKRLPLGKQLFYQLCCLLVGLTVWLSLIGVVTFCSLTGSMLPFLLRRVGFDPATSSAPFVATLVDVTGLVIYFTIALGMLRGTLL